MNKRWFAGLMALDAVALACPTTWLGPRVEFWLALILVSVTGAAWCVLRSIPEDS